MTVLTDSNTEKSHSYATTWVSKHFPTKALDYLENSTVFQPLELSEEARILIQKLNEFRLLPENWDSYGAEKPDTGMINKAKALVRKLDGVRLPLFFVAPGPNGEISIELKKGDLSAELILEDEAGFEVLISKGGELINEAVYEHQDSLIKDLLTHFSA